MMNPKKIVIVGLGLMGASLAAACRKKFPRSRIAGVSRNPASVRMALKRKWIHEGTRDLQAAARDADLVVLCTPVDRFMAILNKLDRCLRPQATVTDVGSVKHRLLLEIEKRPWKNMRFVGAHPMVGSHLRGAAAARENLYDGGFTFVVRNPRTDPGAFYAVKGFWKRLTAKVVEVTSLEHDRCVSQISHLPHVAAVCMMLAVGEKSLPFASAGFRDATRMAQGDASVWMPILKGNHSAIKRDLDAFEEKIHEFGRLLASRRFGRIRKMLVTAARRRQQI